MKRRRERPLPLPTSWLTRPAWTGREVDYKEAVIDGRGPKPGTKTHLKSTLLSLGWSSEDTDLVLSGRFHPLPKLRDLWLEQSEMSDPNVTAAAAALQKKGFPAEPLLHTTKTTAGWVEEVWTSYARQPWWLSTQGGPRSVAFVGGPKNLTRTTAAFVLDMWMNVGEAPQIRMPAIRRLNLLSWSSAEALSRFENQIGPSTDLAVVYGGLTDPDHLYETMSYVMALSSSFRGLLLYEAAKNENVPPAMMLTAAQRAGFGLVLEVGGGD